MQSSEPVSTVQFVHDCVRHPLHPQADAKQRWPSRITVGNEWASREQLEEYQRIAAGVTELHTFIRKADTGEGLSDEQLLTVHGVLDQFKLAGPVRHHAL